jgi:hypothetical protein
MIYLCHQKLRGWTRPNRLHDQPQPIDFAIDYLEFHEQCEFMAARQAEYDALYSRIDATADSWQCQVEQADLEDPDVKASAMVRIQDLGPCLLGTLDSTDPADKFTEAIVLFPLGRRAKFDPGTVERLLGVLGADRAKAIAAKMAKCYWDCRDGSIAFAVTLVSPTDDQVYGALNDVTLMVTRATQRFAAERDKAMRSAESDEAAA